MKTFRRITSLALSFALIIASVFTMCAFAEEAAATDVAEGTKFTDVSEDNAYYEAIYSLAGDGVITGFPDGTFKSDSTITRAEFAAILARATAKGVTLTATTSKFPDVAADYWANPYIAYAVSTGAINGCDDGTFRPENPVSYGEAVKMLVCTLGYASVVAPTNPWYDGYISIANQISLSKNAYAASGAVEASRGIVSQLVYNMASCKKLVQTGTTSDGKPIFKSDDDENEEESGIVTAVYEDSLTGEATGLNKQQIKIDDVVYDIGEYKIESLTPFLGKCVDFEYTESAKKVIEKISESSTNKYITVTDSMFEKIDGRKLTYYKEDSNKETSITLSKDLKVIYNGYGVSASEIDDEFIKTYLSISSGEILLINNDGNSDYDVAFVTSYETYYVTGVTTTDNGIKFYDTYGPVKEVELDTDECTVYKVTTKGGAKSAATLSSIVKNSVVSIARPFGKSENIEVIVSSAKTTSKISEKSSDDEVTIGTEKYKYSDYYQALVDADENKYDLTVGDNATCYLDFRGYIVYSSKTESTQPYGYLVGIASGSGLGAQYEAKIFTTSGTFVRYKLKDSIKVNGKSMTPSSAADALKESADAINAKKTSAALAGTYEYSQLIKYKTSSSGELSEIYTVDASSPENGEIVPGSFKVNSTDEKDIYSDGEGKLKYNSAGKAFQDESGGNQFIINTSTIVFNIPEDRDDDDSYKKRTYSYFSNNVKYVVEPYDIESNSAKVVLVYASGASTVNIDTGAFCAFIENISVVQGDNDENVQKITYYKSNDSSKTYEIKTEKENTVTGIEPGDVVRFAIDNNKVVGFQRLFVGGELYDYKASNPYETFKADNNYIVHNSSASDEYYKVMYGTLNTNNVEGETGTITVVPRIVTDASEFTDDGWQSFNINSSTKYFEWDSQNSKFKTTRTADSLIAADDSDAVTATKLVVISMDKAVKAVYILE